MLFEQKRFSGFALLIITQVILWLFYFFRPLVGADPYFYLSGVCQNNIVSPDLMFFGLLHLLPCNVFVFQLVLLFVWLATLFVFLKIGELFDKQRGWWLPVIVSSMTFFVFEFWKFENNVFGYFFVFTGFYFLFKVFLNKPFFSFFRKKDLKDLFFLVLCFFVGGLFWKGSVYWLFILPLYNFLFLPLLGVFLLPDFFGFFGMASTTGMIYEHTMFIGILYLFMTPLFLIGFIKTNEKIVLTCLILLIPCVLALKMYVLPILFISIITFNCFKMFEKKIDVNLTLKIWTILMLVFFTINLGTQFPTQDDYFLVQQTIQINPNIENTFGTGYLIRYLGGQETKYGSYSTPTQQKGIVIEITEHDYSENCELLFESRHLRSWNCD